MPSSYLCWVWQYRNYESAHVPRNVKNTVGPLPWRSALFFFPLLIQHRFVAELFQHLDDGEALADSLGHSGLLPRHRLGLLNHLLLLLARNEDHAAAVRDDRIPGAHPYSGELDLLVEGILRHPSPRGHGNQRARVNRKSHFPALVNVSPGAVDDHTPQPSGFGCQGQEPAPGRDIRPPAAVDDDDVSGPGGFNRLRAPMVLRLFQTGRFDLDRHRAPDDPRAGPKGSNAEGSASKTQPI